MKRQLVGWLTRWLLTVPLLKSTTRGVSRSGSESILTLSKHVLQIEALTIEVTLATNARTTLNALMKPPYVGSTSTLVEMAISTSLTMNADSSTADKSQENENTFQFSNSRRVPGESKKCQQS